MSVEEHNILEDVELSERQRGKVRVTQVGCYWVGGGHTELYLIETDRLIMIDSGVIESPEEYIAPALEQRGRQLSEVSIVINTHGHHDHAGGNASLKRASGAEIWISEHDAAVAKDLRLQYKTFFVNNDRLVGREDRMAQSFAHVTATAEPSPVDRLIVANERLALGNGLVLRAVPIPGHTLGCIGFYWEEEKLMFTGDAIPGRGSRPGSMPLIYHPEQYEQSLEMLLGMDIQTMCLGHHYRSLSLSRDSVKHGAEVQQYLRESLEVARIIRQSVAEAMDSVGGSEFLPMAQAATLSLVEKLGVKTDPETRLSVSHGVPAIHAYWELLRRPAS